MGSRVTMSRSERARDFFRDIPKRVRSGTSRIVGALKYKKERFQAYLKWKKKLKNLTILELQDLYKRCKKIKHRRITPGILASEESIRFEIKRRKKPSRALVSRIRAMPFEDLSQLEKAYAKMDVKDEKVTLEFLSEWSAIQNELKVRQKH